MTATGFDYGEFLKRWFAAGDEYPGVFVLGSYARYVTLFSQQMRALNLIGAFVKTDQLRRGKELAVVGGGVAGLTAAFAAQHCGWNVTLIEKNQDVIGLQRASQERWIHPHIYDWPAEGSEAPRAGLPILDWEADYAYKVITQFEAFRKNFQASEKRIDKHFLVGDVKLEMDHGSPRLKWGNFSRPFSIVVLAVGFGLEPWTDSRKSYWENDGIDSPRVRTDNRWLIVGSGDSALTDLMRLCIKDFRHADLLSLLPRADLLASVKADLLEIEEWRYKPEKLTDAYKNLVTTELVKDLKRKRTLILRQGKEVCITNSTDWLYDPRASILNRFILRILIDLEAVRHLEGYGGQTLTNGRYEAKFGTRVEVFDRVLERFGPEPKAMRASFPHVWDKSSSLRDLWINLPSEADESRKRWWPAGLFGPETELPNKLSREDIGVSAKSLTVTRQVLSDGRSYVTLAVEGLAVHEGQLRGVWVRLKSVAGELGVPEPDQGARQLGARWKPDEETAIPVDANLEERLQLARERARMISGVMAFDTPLTPDTGPVRIGMRVVMLNAVALSSWEFGQFYDESQRRHIDGSDTHDLEFFARSVWLPVETFKMRLELPPEFSEAPVVRRFRYGPSEIQRTDVVFDGVLNLGPRLGSEPSPWIPDDAALKNWKLTKGTGQSWELEVKAPALGACFSLDWKLPAIMPDERSARVEAKARELRRNLLGYRWRRLEGVTSGDVHEAFRDFDQAVLALCAEGREDERLEVSLMTYNERRRRLEVVETAMNGGGTSPNSWNFWLPFGLGLAGVCFKNPGAYLYVPPPKAYPAGPDYFLPVPGAENNPAVLLALSLDHPEYDDSVKLERSRQCIGVVDITSNLAKAKLIEIATSDRLSDLVTICRNFGERLGTILG